jgi:hypothetical protein
MTWHDDVATFGSENHVPSSSRGASWPHAAYRRWARAYRRAAGTSRRVRRPPLHSVSDTTGMSRTAGRRAALLGAALAACCRVAAGRSAAARASASGSGGGSNTGIVALSSTAAAAPLPPELQANEDAAFAHAAATLAGKPLLCGDLNALQSGYTRPADLGDGFFRVVPSAADSIAAVLAVRPLRCDAKHALRTAWRGARCARRRKHPQCGRDALSRCRRRRSAARSRCRCRTWMAPTCSW